MKSKMNNFRTHRAAKAIITDATHQWPGLVATLTLLACGVAPEDGNIATNESAIQGGVAESGYPAVGLLKGSGYFCTAELIAPSVLLTAAHCMGPSMQFMTGTEPRGFEGHETDTFIQHPSRDLALVHLSEPITNIAPLSLNTGALPAVNSTCTAVGFGIHDEGGTVTSQKKRSAKVTVESASSKSITVLMDSGIPDSGDSGGPLLCGNSQKVCGVVHRHTDGDWPTHIREIYTTLDAGWVNTNLSFPPPPVFNSLYAAQGTNLDRVDDALGYWTVISDEWAGTTSMATIAGSLYVIENNRLHKVKPSDGSYTVLGNPDWAGLTTMTALGSKLYITQGDGLWRISSLSTGARTRLGTAGWTDATSMTSLNSSLYIVQNNRLHKVNPSDGSYVVLGNAIWTGPTTMSTLGSNLYVTQGDGLWKITNLSTGARTRLGTAGWTGATSMTSLFGSLYIIQNNTLHKVNPTDGSYVVLTGTVWSGPTSMVALRSECPTVDTILLAAGSAGSNLGASYVSQIEFSSKDADGCYYYGDRYDITGPTLPAPTSSGKISCERYGEFCWMSNGQRIVCDAKGYCTPG